MQPILPSERTLPQVFFGPLRIGGFDKLQAFFAAPQTPYLLGPVELPPLRAKRLSVTAGELTRGSAEAVGLDIRADLTEAAGPAVLRPGQVLALATGWALQAPPGHYLRVAPRSGLALKGVDTLAGVVDRDYTGEVRVVLTNHSQTPVTIDHGDRIAQIIVERAGGRVQTMARAQEPCHRSMSHTFPLSSH